jgi:hypothetical protein
MKPDPTVGDFEAEEYRKLAQTILPSQANIRRAIERLLADREVRIEESRTKEDIAIHEQMFGGSDDW